jgi:hypothetical protein
VDLLERVETPSPGHAEIEDDQVEGRAHHQCDGFFARARFLELCSAELFAEKLAHPASNDGVVVDE